MGQGGDLLGCAGAARPRRAGRGLYLETDDLSAQELQAEELQRVRTRMWLATAIAENTAASSIRATAKEVALAVAKCIDAAMEVIGKFDDRGLPLSSQPLRNVKDALAKLRFDPEALVSTSLRTSGRL
eukprot:784838-Prymnesium_polylepis.1